MVPTEPRTFLNDGEHYDSLHAALRDVEYWVRQARQVGGAVLELACGTGRIAIPIAESGLPVVGIDISEAYISWARRKSEGRGLNVGFDVADIRHFSLGRLFRFVAFPFRSVSVLLTDDDLHSCFACVRRHIEVGGLFVVDAFTRSSAAAVTSSAKLRYPNPDGTGMVEVVHERRLDPTGRSQTSVFTFPHAASGVPAREELRLRMYTAEELTAALHANGFELVRHFGGYDEIPFTEAAPLQLLVGSAV